MYSDIGDKIELIQVLSVEQDLTEQIHLIELSDSRDENNGNNCYLLAVLYYRIGLYERSLEKLGKALQLGYDERKVWRALGLVNLSLGQFDKAVDAYMRSTETGTPDRERDESISRVLHEKKAYLELESAVRKREVDISTFMLLAEQRSNYHQYRGCLDACNTVLEKDPQNRSARILQAHCSFSLVAQMQQPQKLGFEAVVQSGKLAAQEPENIDFVWFHGLCLNLWGLSEEEYVVWHHYVKLADSRADGTLNWVREKRMSIAHKRLDALQQKKNLLYRFGRFVSICPRMERDLLDQGLSSVGEWDILSAERILKETSFEESLVADGFFNLGYLHYCKKEVTQAILAFEKALSVEANFEEAKINLDLLTKKDLMHFRNTI